MATAAVFPGVFFWLFGLGGMSGLPMGMPPLPEDPILAKAAPAECLFYTMSAGVAAPDAKSANQTEQFLAEPEVSRLVAEVEKLLVATVKREAARKGPQGEVMADDLVYAVKTAFLRPMAIYLSDVKPAPGGPPEIRGGALLNAGEEVEKIKTLLKRYQKLAFPESAETTIGSRTFQTFKLPGGGPEVTWGVAGRHLLVTVGEGEMQSLMDRVKGEPPQWLVKIKKDLPVERLSTVARIDLKAIREKFGPLAGPQFAAAMETTGLDAVTQLAAVSGLDKDGCVNRMQVAIEGEPRGLLALIDQAPLTAKDLEVLPRDATFAVAASFDAAKAIEIVLSVIEQFDAREAKNFRDGMKRAEQETGVNIQSDLLQSLGTTLWLFDSPSGGGAFTGATAVWSLRNPERFTASMDALVKVAEAAMQTPHNRGPKLDRVKVGKNEIMVFMPNDRNVLIAPSWCIAGDKLVIGLYPQAVKAFLAREERFESLAKVPAVAETVKGGETIKLAYMNTQRLFDLVYPMLPIAMQGMANELRRENIELPADLLPAAGAVRPHLLPGVISVKRTKAGLEFESRQSLPSSGVLSSAPLAAGPMIPAVQSARAAARKAQSATNLKNIATAMHINENEHGTFPAAFAADKEGKPLLSWRVAILPYIDQTELYRQFKLDEPWDSEHNKRLIDKMPAIYRSPNSNAPPGHTNYLTIRGDRTAFPGARGTTLANIRDGMSNTIMAVEVSDEKAVPWTKPDDFQPDERNPLKGLVGLQPGGFTAAFCDGSVHFISAAAAPDALRALFNRDDGMPVNWNGDVPGVSPQTQRDEPRIVDRERPREEAPPPSRPAGPRPAERAKGG